MIDIKILHLAGERFGLRYSDSREWKKGLLASLFSGDGGRHEHF
jgi:hypothetical protein